MRAILFDGWIYGENAEEIGCSGICFSVGGYDTGLTTEDGRRIFDLAGMVCDEGAAAVLPADASDDECELIELCLNPEDEE